MRESLGWKRMCCEDNYEDSWYKRHQLKSFVDVQNCAYYVVRIQHYPLPLTDGEPTQTLHSSTTTNLHHILLDTPRTNPVKPDSEMEGLILFLSFRSITTWCIQKWWRKFQKRSLLHFMDVTFKHGCHFQTEFTLFKTDVQQPNL